jgi:hypothetical protein
VNTNIKGNMQRIGNFGLSIFRTTKPQAMIVLGVLNCVSLIGLCVSLAGASTDQSIIKSSSWAYGTYDGKTYNYLGLKAWVNRNEATKNWDADNCNNDYCDQCSSAGQVALSATGFAFAFEAVTIALSFLRFKSDSNLVKLASILMSAVGYFCLIVAMCDWTVQCINNLDNEKDDDYFKNFTYALGAGFNCALTAFFVMFFTFLVHVATPVDGAKEALLGNAK